MEEREVHEYFKKQKALWLERIEKKKAFAKSHKPRKCDYCGTEIDPGDDVIVDAVHVFCDYDCFGSYHGAKRLIFNENEYASIFQKREETENDV